MKYEDIKKSFELLFENRLSAEDAKNFLVELYEKGEEAEEIAAAAEVMKKHALMLSLSDDLKELLIDNVGTGGDKSNTFNISSTVSIVLASLGCYVAKHGNRSITSRSGSADMLEAIGIKIDLGLEQKKAMLEECGFVFLFAQNHHPAMKHIMPIRKSIEHRTIFNILGPLTNPADVKKYLIGVFSTEYVSKMTKALELLGSSSAIVVSSLEGLDEAGLDDISIASWLHEGRIEQMEIDPQSLGFARASKSELLGGDASINAQITYNILKGELSGAKRDAVVLNCALALLADGKVRDLKEGIEMAKYALDSKKAFDKLNQIINISKQL